MKKTTKKLNIKKETVAAFATLSEKEMVAVNGGGRSGSPSERYSIEIECEFSL